MATCGTFTSLPCRTGPKVADTGLCNMIQPQILLKFGEAAPLAPTGLLGASGANVLFILSSHTSSLVKSKVNNEKIKRAGPADFISPFAITAPSISGLRIRSSPLIGPRLVPDNAPCDQLRGDGAGTGKSLSYQHPLDGKSQEGIDRNRHLSSEPIFFFIALDL